MWTRKQYEDAAQQIGNAYTSSNGTQSINDLALKVAQDGGLNPEGIRTVVRLANVAVFENMFGKAASDGAPDRMFDFSVGDPEQIINQLGCSVKTAFDKTAAPASSYDRTSDYYGDIDYRPYAVKTASEAVHIGIERPVSQPVPAGELRNMFKRAEAIMAAQKKQAEMYWFSTMEKAAQLLRVNAGTHTAREAFEKDAVATLGESIVPELRMVRRLTGASIEGGFLDSMDKVAHVQEFHLGQVAGGMVDVLNAVKEASEARAMIHYYERAVGAAVQQREAIK